MSNSMAFWTGNIIPRVFKRISHSWSESCPPFFLDLGGVLEQSQVPDCGGHLLFLGFPAPFPHLFLRAFWIPLVNYWLLTAVIPGRTVCYEPCLLARAVIGWSWPITLYSGTVHVAQGNSRTGVWRGTRFISIMPWNHWLLSTFWATQTCPFWTLFFRPFFNSLSCPCLSNKLSLNLARVSSYC